MKELNERQIELYKYLIKEQNYVHYVSKTILMKDLDYLYRRSQEKCAIVNSTAYRKLRYDIEIINKSNAQYVILSVKKEGKLQGYKIANKNEEILKQADKLHRQAMRLLEQEKFLRLKVKNDGQFRISGEDETKVIKSTL